MDRHPDANDQQPIGERPLSAMLLVGLFVYVWFGGCSPERIVAVTEDGGGPGGMTNSSASNSGGASSSPDAGASGGADTVSSSGGTTATCGTLNGPCAEPQDCCSGICGSTPHGKACLMPPTCRKATDPCTVPSDCCSGMCGTDGHCPDNAGCNLIGEPCNSSGECCSGACSDPGSGSRSCQALDGCRPIGEVCNTGPECCSQYCTFDANSGYSHCTAAPNCASAGELCVDGSTDIRCCSAKAGGMSPADACLETLVGVSRCQFAGAQNGECRGDGSLCKFGAECCGRFCQPDPNGDLRCSGMCLPEHSPTPCLSSRDCCVGTCVNGACKVYGTTCSQLGQRCSSGPECCSGVCTSSSTSTYSHCTL
jgi:hypothetical protein